MPALSKAQQSLFAIAEHHPDKLRGAHKRLAELPKKTLHEFASTPRSRLKQRIGKVK